MLKPEVMRLLASAMQKTPAFVSNIVTAPEQKDAVPAYRYSLPMLRPNPAMSPKIRLHVRTFILALLTLAGTACGARMPQTVPAQATATYTVQPGDTLSGIAVEFDTTVDTLIALNTDQYPAISNPRRLVAGWQIEVPLRAGTVMTASDDAPTTPVTSAVQLAPTPVPNNDYFDYDAALDIIRLTNEERAKVGLAPLAADEQLMDIARRRAMEIVSDYSHAGLADDCPDCGENIFGRYTVESPVAVWMNSEGHRAGILYPDYTRIGVGVYVVNGKRWAVQIFR